jgi:hypothetical protein
MSRARPAPKRSRAKAAGVTKSPERGAAKAGSQRGATKAGAGTRGTVRIREIDSLREELERRTASLTPARWNADPEEVQRSVARLVLTLIEFLRQLFEKQAIRRMEQGTLTGEETEKLGVALMRLEETVRDLAGRFGLTPDELNLDLGPLGRLR